MERTVNNKHREHHQNATTKKLIKLNRKHYGKEKIHSKTNKTHLWKIAICDIKSFIGTETELEKE